MWDDPSSRDAAELFRQMRPAAPPDPEADAYAPVSFNAAATPHGLLLRVTDGEREVDVELSRYMAQALIVLVARAAAAQDWFPDPDPPESKGAASGSASAPGLPTGRPANDAGPAEER